LEEQKLIPLIMVFIITTGIIIALSRVSIAMRAEAKRLATREEDNAKIFKQYDELLAYERENKLFPTPPPSTGIGISGCRWSIPHENQVKHFQNQESK
jgi:hypothetical protein